MLAFIGIGYSRRHLTQESLELLRSAEKIYIDTYTSMYEDGYEWIRDVNPSAEIIVARRRDLEGDAITRIVEESVRKNVAIVCAGDPFTATTHDAIRVEALKRGVEVRVATGISIVSLVHSRIGLQAYRFGKIVTLVYPDNFKPYSVVETIYDNLSRNLHTLILLDLRLEEGVAMTIPEAVEILGGLDDKGLILDQVGVAVARLGWSSELVKAGRVRELGKHRYPPPPHSLIITAKLHPVELESLRYIAGLQL
ncbi:diphthine synthase [Desulfurococcus mucosus]|uniref:Diphthine synthase n=1 Tax=Desulfurococcus mucosus (strain ATCC 35584 / DSM 2162 / JCM 9187 / O7/1) TaxID=765177 RepID=E8R725_DESM0|nr:diphthine synthase [Desulfurococcus mucosus]ADV64458.1 diphthine synthase [Desulfurococcus mucosus DSM 2162]